MIKIGKKAIGPGRPVFIIAEAGVNHNGRLDLALRLVDEAARLGADAVKFQTFVTELLVTRGARSPKYQKAPANSQFALLKNLELSFDDFVKIARHCARRKIEFLSSSFDLVSLEFLVKLGVKALKIGSGEMTNTPLVDAAARSGRPVILSTGMSDLAEVGKAVGIFSRYGAEGRLVLLHCVSQYPAPMGSLNLRAMQTLEREFGLPVGFSDHSQGIVAACAAVALGARVVEKHFTLDNNMKGPDHASSADPAEFRELIGAVRSVEVALGTGRKAAQGVERDVRELARKSIVSSCAIRKGVKVMPYMLTTKRPGTGLAPDRMAQVVGRTASRDIPADTIINAGMFK